MTVLHDPGIYSPPPAAADIKLSRKEKETLRPPGEEIALIAAETAMRCVS